MWEVDLEIPYKKGLDAFEVARDLENEFGYAESTGSGFGYRDMQFSFDRQAQALEFFLKVEEWLKERGYVLGGNVVAVSLATFPGVGGDAYIGIHSFPELP